MFIMSLLFSLLLGYCMCACHGEKTRLKFRDPAHGDHPGKFPRWLNGKEPSFNISTIPKPEDSPLGDPDRFPIFPPKHNPGEIMEGIEHSELNFALDEVLKSADMLHDRTCSIAIANEGTATLTIPSWAMNMGHIHTSAPINVKTGHASLNLFTKNKGLASGTSGILAYDVEGTGYRVIVMWSMPFDMNIYDVWFNMKVYPRSVGITEDLWSHMYYDAGPWLARGWRERTEFGIRVRATMTEHRHSKLIMWVNADNFSGSGSYDLFTECSYHPWWFGYYCNQECFASGWCWVDRSCDSDSDCGGRYTCYSGC